MSDYNKVVEVMEVFSCPLRISHDSSDGIGSGSGSGGGGGSVSCFGQGLHCIGPSHIQIACIDTFRSLITS